jgi:phosphoribosylanthranilate isomerase
VAVEAKICGLRRPEDARLAARLGAAWLGVVLDSGPRQASLSELRAVVEAAGGVPVLGVAVHRPVDDLLALRDSTGIAGVQLHGDYADDGAARLRGAGLIVWRVARLAAPGAVNRIPALTRHADAVLVERSVTDRAGGSGAALPLEWAGEARAAITGVPMVLAGGLTPETVARVAALVRPEVVDVSSGVERAPGIKDPARVARFLEALIDINARA